MIITCTGAAAPQWHGGSNGPRPLALSLVWSGPRDQMPWQTGTVSGLPPVLACSYPEVSHT